MTDILEIYLLVALGCSAFTQAFFWYESAYGPHPHREYLEKLSGGRVGWWILRGILTGFGSILLVSILFPLGFLRKFRFSKPSGDDALPPVILAHGLYHNASAWALYRWRLRRSGFSTISAFNYPSFGVSFGEILERLEKFVREVEAATPGRKPVMIGHSLGGLLCRAFADAPENAGRIHAVVSLGAPHRGSKLAALSLGRLGQSLIFQGPLFRDLERNKAPVGSHRLAVFTPTDSMVLPFEALKIEDPAWRLLEVEPVGHIGLLFHPATARRVIDYLLHAPK